MLNLLDVSIRKLTQIKNKIKMSEVMTEDQIFVWSKTEQAGKIVVVAKEQPDAKWLYFTDGTRVNAKMVSEFLLPANSQEDAENMAVTFGAIIASPQATIKKVETKQERRITDGKSAPDPEVNVMMEMLSKMSKKNTAEMPVSVNIPSSAVYEMLKEEMDLEEADLNEQIGLLIENQINNLQDQLRSQINSFITNYYKQ